MKLLGVLLGVLCWTSAAFAGVTAFDYHLGATRATEDQRQIVVHAKAPVVVAILPGGKSWPALSLDEIGNIYVGGAIIDATTGGLIGQTDATLALPHGVQITALTEGYRLRRGGRECRLSPSQLNLTVMKPPLATLQDANLIFSAGKDALLSLATQFGPDGRVRNYLVERIDMDRCKVITGANLGNPDLLVEMMHSERGGWWITGSVEQTLLRSNDGHRWNKVPLPASLSSLVSAYIVNEHEIWLAAVLPDDNTPSPYLLVYSADGGRHWRNIVAADRLLARLPVGWLEGQKRRVPQDSP